MPESKEIFSYKEYECKNYRVSIINNADAAYHEFGGFMSFMDTDAALSVKWLTDIIKKMDEEGKKDWKIFGWYMERWQLHDEPDPEYLEKNYQTTLFTEGYLLNSELMDKAWESIPCLRIGCNEGHISINFSQSPYLRTLLDSTMGSWDIIRFDNVAFGKVSMDLGKRNGDSIDWRHGYLVPTVFEYSESGRLDDYHGIIFSKNEYDEMSEELREREHELIKRWGTWDE